MALCDAAYCISLTRRVDRWQAFCDRWPGDAALPRPQRFPAVDGTLCPPPEWWRAGRGAWGCLQSHLAVIQAALMQGLNSVAIFEDDCTFTNDFDERLRSVFAALPADCAQLYLGGQHLLPPADVPGQPALVRVANCNRTHAYCLMGRDNLARVYQFLCNQRSWEPRHHIDHRYGVGHETHHIAAYAPRHWLCGQAAGMSDVCERAVPSRMWVAPHAIGPPLPFVAIMGLHRSGSSALAMLCHKLGVSMGRKLGGYENRNGGGGEAVTLAALCEEFCRFPRAHGQVTDQLTSRMRAWIAERCAEDMSAGRRTGGKYPHLCALGKELHEICGSGLRVIVCQRPLDESIESLRRRSASATGFLRATESECETVQRWLHDERATFLESFDPCRVLTVSYEELLARPRMVAARVAQFCGLTASEKLIDHATAHIDKTKRTV